jgi:NAD-dependent SIR2 family protein deacetylase
MSSSLTFNVDLLDDLANKRVVLFVGAGASKWAKPRGGGTFRGWREFLEFACEKIDQKKLKHLIKQQIDKSDFLIASELIKDALKEEWRTVLLNEFQQAADASRLHKALISLEQRIIVTTNFDKLIENAWSESCPNSWPTVISTVDAKAFRLFRDSNPYVIKLHGSIDDPGSVVFDKSSYQKSAFYNQFYRELIGTLLLTHTFIFVGFSMEDPAVSLFIESHAFRYGDTRPHYIFMPGREISEIDELSRKLRKLFVLRYSEKDEHVALVEALEQLAVDMRDRRRLTLGSASA